MSLLAEHLHTAAAFHYPASVELFQKNIPLAWVDAALTQTGRAAVRKRRFPAEQAVWLVLGIGLMRNRSVSDVCDKLDLAFPDSKGEFPPMATSSLVKARERLGAQPLNYLFRTTAEHWENEDPGDTVCGLKLMCVDGTQLHVPDTHENREFGWSGGQTGYPSVQIVTLISAHSHLISDAAFGPVSKGEISYAQELVSSAPARSLTLFDRGYLSAELLLSWEGSGPDTHWLTPARANLRYKVLECYTEHDMLIEMPVSSSAREQYPHLPKVWQARLILIAEPKGELKGFITSLRDPQKYPYGEIEKVYWCRWEIERSYSELKLNQLANESVLRSQKKEGIYQEIWGILLGYNLVRLEMKRMAEELKVEPLRISFINALRLIQDEFLWSSGRTPGTIPKNLQNLRKTGKRLIMAAKRKRKACPREVLQPYSKYPTKKKAARA